MDPIGLLLAVYLDSIANVTHRHFQDSMDTQLQAVRIEYEGSVIDFQHQLWRVRDDSVCGSLRSDLRQYSACTVKAKDMFAELCQALSEKKDNHWRIAKSQNMYCNAANSFRPTEASIMRADEPGEFEQARQRCNIATAAALGSSDRTLIKERDEACEALKVLRSVENPR
jgi:hypothetical protein